MAQQRSIIGHLTLTAWESWEAEAHWRNAVIIAIVGSIAFSVSSPSSNNASQQSQTIQPSTPTSSTGTPATSQPPQIMMNGGSTLLTPKSKVPPKLKPKLSTDDVVIKEPEEDEKPSDFGRSYGE